VCNFLHKGVCSYLYMYSEYTGEHVSNFVDDSLLPASLSLSFAPASPYHLQVDLSHSPCVCRAITKRYYYDFS
jgi:hypothetical protein